MGKNTIFVLLTQEKFASNFQSGISALTTNQIKKARLLQ